MTCCCCWSKCELVTQLTSPSKWFLRFNISCTLELKIMKSFPRNLIHRRLSISTRVCPNFLKITVVAFPFATCLANNYFQKFFFFRTDQFTIIFTFTRPFLQFLHLFVLVNSFNMSRWIQYPQPRRWRFNDRGGLARPGPPGRARQRYCNEIWCTDIASMSHWAVKILVLYTCSWFRRERCKTAGPRDWATASYMHYGLDR